MQTPWSFFVYPNHHAFHKIYFIENINYIVVFT